MKFRDILKEQRETLTARWIEQTIATYPEHARLIFGNVDNRFGNPVGQTIKTALTGLFDALVVDGDDESFAEPLDSIVRVRAVQDFSPSEAVSFILYLKIVVRDTLSQSTLDQNTKGLIEFDEAVDNLMLRAFDTYVNCREQIFQIRANETKARYAMLVQRANKILERDGAGKTNQMTFDERQKMKGGERS